MLFHAGGKTPVAVAKATGETRLVRRKKARLLFADVRPGEERRLEGGNAPQPPQETRDPLGEFNLNRAVWRKLGGNAGAQIGEVFGASRRGEGRYSLSAHE